MLNLKQLRTRIKSIKSTKKITKAMQLVSASKLTKIKNQIIHSSFYIEVIREMMSTILSNDIQDLPLDAQKFFVNESNKFHLLVVLTSERGLCGTFNYGIIKQVKSDIKDLENKGKKIKLIIVGKKGYEPLKRLYVNYIDSYFELSKIHHDNLLSKIKTEIMAYIDNAEISNCSIYFNKFKNAITQIVTKQQILPVEKYEKYEKINIANSSNLNWQYEGENLVSNLINLYVNSQLNYTLLQNIASEEGARMTAMENATNNANELVEKLTLKLNRSRQAIITTELIEIISGAEVAI